METELGIYLSEIAERDVDVHFRVRPKPDVRERLSAEIERISGCRRAQLPDAAAELFKPARILPTHKTAFASKTLEAVQEAAKMLRQLSAKRFELWFGTDTNDDLQFRVRFD